MEKGGRWDNRKSVIRALSEGMELANEMKNQLHSNPTSTDHHQASAVLLQSIVSCYDNAIQLLHDCMPLSALGTILRSPIIEVSDRDFEDQLSRDFHKKRKRLPGGSESLQVRLCSGTGFESQLDDGFNWRKYGQKDILGANHPRAYYRCTHRHKQGCHATKQVQPMDDNPSTVEVVYKGKHSCIQGRLKLKKENVNVQRKAEESQRFSQQMMIGIEPDVKVETPELDHQEEDFPSTLTQPENVETQFFSEANPFFSRAMSESCFSLSPGQVNNFGFGHNFLGSE
ncbi:UNVERIFIED_CONTAM: putative WRKY transcription factor 41 [Sesamum latifolium]|uniref:WRKY transcription factor 41 n=1 Tax=Sesamum latifolium TaxID=2727402 RepID=A0AAW2U651_9LAMI